MKGAAATDARPLASFVYPREVRLVDTDATGLVHFAVYVRMMEETEYAFLRSRGLSVVLHDDRGTMGFPRLKTSLKVHQPLVFEQTVSVELQLVMMDGKQLEYGFSIFSTDQTLAVEGTFQVAFCRFPDRGLPYAILIPDWVSDALTRSPP